MVLLYGDDHGRIRERAEQLVVAVTGSLRDPFRICDLDRDAIGDLAGEAAGLPLVGGRLVVRVRDVSDAALQPVKAVLGGSGSALVILEGPGLPARSRLRSALEEAPHGAAIACYPEHGHALEETLRLDLQRAGVTIDPDALALAASRLGDDRLSARGEADKLALYVGPGGRVTADVVAACLMDAASLALDDAFFAATDGDRSALDRAISTALSAGVAPASVVRGALIHLQRLQKARLDVAGGVEAGAAIRSLRPPVFWQRDSAFRRALALWTLPALTEALRDLARAERMSRAASVADVTICFHALSSLADSAARLREDRKATASGR